MYIGDPLAILVWVVVFIIVVGFALAIIDWIRRH